MIGLALGGGSAKGFAHIGVLRWLEENRIPVDYIAGTSMGGLMAGCYAMGMSPQEIHEFVKEINWDLLFNPLPPYDVLDFRRKEDRRDYPIEMQFGVKDKAVRIPAGSSVHQVGLLLSRLTLPYATVRQFDQLPIPYRCVATDIVKAEPVVLGEGSLADAMRATMAIPGVFTPVEINGRMLVDGGVLDNVPVDVVREMQPTIVIAVNVTAKIRESEAKSLDSVLLNTVNTVITENSRRIAATADIVLEPDLLDLHGTDWTQADAFIRAGYQAAAEHAEALKKYQMDPVTWQKYLVERQNRRKFGVPTPTRLEVTGANAVNSAMIQKKLTTHLGRSLDTVRLEADLTSLTGTGLFESLRYDYTVRERETILVIKAIEKAYGPPFVDSTLIIESESSRAEHVDINARIRSTWFNVVGPRSEFRLDLGIGTEIHLLGELYKPLSDSETWFIAPAVYLEQKNSNLFDGEIRSADYKATETGLHIDLGYAFGKHAEARLGYYTLYQDLSTRIGEDLDARYDGMIQKIALKYTYSRGDRPILPRNGLDLNFMVNWYLNAPDADTPFDQAELSLARNFPVGREDSFFIRFGAGSTYHGTAAFPQLFTLGGPFRLATYKIDQFRGQNYLLSNVGYLHHLGDSPLFKKPVYFGFWVEHGGVFDRWNERQIDVDVSFGIFSPALFGPIYVGASYGQGANPVFNILVGHLF